MAQAQRITENLVLDWFDSSVPAWWPELGFQEKREREDEKVEEQEGTAKFRPLRQRRADHGAKKQPYTGCCPRYAMSRVQSMVFVHFCFTSLLLSRIFTKSYSYNSWRMWFVVFPSEPKHIHVQGPRWVLVDWCVGKGKIKVWEVNEEIQRWGYRESSGSSYSESLYALGSTQNLARWPKIK